MDPLREKIVLELDGAGIKSNSLEALIGQLDSVRKHVEMVNAAMGNLKLGPEAARSAAVLEAEIKRLQSRTGLALKVPELSKALGLDQSAFEAHLARFKGQVKAYQATLQEFRSARAAASAIAGYERRGVATRMTLTDLLTPKVSSVTGAPGSVSVPGSAIAAKVEGPISLVIPGSQVQASVAGPVTATGGTGRDAQGRFLPAGGGGGTTPGKGGKAATKGPLAVGGVGGELQRVRTETEKSLTEAVTAVNAAGQIITTVHDSVEGIIKTQTKRTTGQSPLAAYKEARAIAEEQFKQAKAALAPGDRGFGLATVLEKQAAQLRGLKSGGFMQTLGPVASGQISNVLEQQAKTLEAQAAGARSKALSKQKEEIEKRIRDNEKILERGQQARADQALRDARKEDLGRITKPPVLKPPKLTPDERENLSERNRFARGVRGLTTFSGFGANLMNVASWAAPVTLLYKGFALAEHSVSRFIEISRDMAQLQNVYRGVGGSVQELTGDLLNLAVANGRDTDEAMKSGHEWARLGLTRQQIGEAVKVSMEAANIADMHTLETTKQLSSLMHVYGLAVSDLQGTLGMLVNTSQSYNISLEEMFQGLDRSAATARLAGVSLAELQGIIAATVGETGQSGSVIGNAVKTLLVDFNRPEMQRFMRSFGIETTTAGGAQKSGSQILREIFVKWQGFSATEKQSLTMEQGGRFNAARFTGIYNSYVESQKLAINSQLHLNAAQQANERILQTLSAQLTSVRGEWDKLIMSILSARGTLGNENLGQDLVQGASFAKNMISIGSTRLYRGLRTAFDLARNPGSTIRGELGEAALRVLGFPGAANAYGAGGLTGWINYGFASPLERGHEAYVNAVQKHAMAAGGFLEKSQFFQTMSAALANAPKGERSELASSMADMLGPQEKAFQGAINSGKLGAAQDILASASKKARAQAFEEKIAEFKASSERIGKANLQIEQAQAEIKALEGQKDKTNELARANGRLAEAKAARAEATETLSEDESYLYALEKGEVTDAYERKQQYINLLQEQRQAMEVIGQLSSQQAPEFASSRNQAAIQSLRQQQQGLEAAAYALFKGGKIGEGQEAHDTYLDVQRQLAEVRGDLAARSSPRVREMLQHYDNRAMVARRAIEESQTASVGRTEGEKLLNEQAYLREQLGQAYHQYTTGSLSENEVVRAKQLEIQLWQTQERIQSRILEMTREERQVRLDATREFQKNLLLAGPGEQLQRLYVSSLLHRPGGISAGEFNALSPEAKRMYYEATGGERGALLRQEHQLLQGRFLPTDQFQQQAAAARRHIGQWDTNAFNNTGNYPMALPLMETAKRIADQLNSLGAALGHAATQANGLGDSLAKLHGHIGGAGAASATQRSVRAAISPGYSLGAGFMPEAAAAAGVLY